MPATIRDVARACGVHVSTVSRTFSAPNLVNPETRGRVLATAEHLGYRLVDIEQAQLLIQPEDDDRQALDEMLERVLTR